MTKKKFKITFIIFCPLLFIGFVIAFEYFVKNFFPLYDPSGRISYITENNLPLLKERNKTLNQWKKTGGYNVSIYSNNLGLRNRKNLYLVDEKALYVVGDSYAFGHGVEEFERFSDILENKYNIGEVVNIAIPTDVEGYYNLVEYAKKNGAKINKLMVTLCMENDIKNYDNDEKSIQNKKKQKRGLFRWLKGFLTENSALYNLLTSAVHQNKQLSNIALKFGIMSPYLSSMRLSSNKELKSTVNLINKIKLNFSPKEFYVFLVPSRGLWFSEKKNDYLKEHIKLKNLLINKEIIVIDPKNEFELSKNPKKYFFKHDAHWNSLGHDLAAQVLFKTFSNIK